MSPAAPWLADLTLLAWPAAAGVLVLLSHVSLGEQVLQRGIVFIDLAVAQVAALGVLVASTWVPHLAHGVDHGGHDHVAEPHSSHVITQALVSGTEAGLGWLAAWPTLFTLVAGGLSALAGAALVAWLCRRWPARREALIGLVYVGAAVLALLWTSADPRGGQHLAGMLSGDVLWVGPQQLLPLGLATALFLALQRLRPLWLQQGAGFYIAFALLVSLSVPLLGLYLVFAVLIVPALAASSLGRCSPGGRRGAALAVGGLGFALGLGASLLLDLPAGPCAVLGLLLAGGALAALRPRLAA